MTENQFAIQVQFHSFESLEKVREMFKWDDLTKDLTVEPAPNMLDQFLTVVMCESPNISDAVEVVSKGLVNHLFANRIRLLRVFWPVTREQKLGDPPARDLAVSECAYCHCTQAKPCRTDQGPCHWLPDVVVDEKPVCSHPECVEKFRLCLPAISLESLRGRDMNRDYE